MPLIEHMWRMSAVSISTRYVLIASMDVTPEAESLFNEVYDTEHVPNLLQVPGVHSVTRMKGPGRLFMPLSGHSLRVNRSDQVGGIRPFPDLLGLLCRQCKDGHLLMKPDHLTLRLLWVPNSSKRDRAVDADAQLGSLTISPRAAQDWSKATRERDSSEARQVCATNRASISRGETCDEAPNISYRRCGVRGRGCVDAVPDYGRRPAGAVELSAR